MQIALQPTYIGEGRNGGRDVYLMDGLTKDQQFAWMRSNGPYRHTSYIPLAAQSEG